MSNIYDDIFDRLEEFLHVLTDYHHTLDKSCRKMIFFSLPCQNRLMAYCDRREGEKAQKAKEVAPNQNFMMIEREEIKILTESFFMNV